MLSPNSAAGAAEVVSKSRFAELCRVSPARVSQWISEKKISGDALVGEGRAAHIRVAAACAQLKRNLDPSQRFGNGIATRLESAPSPEAPVPTAPAIPAPPVVQQTALEPAPDDSIEGLFKREKLEQLLRLNRKAAREEAMAAGQLTDADAARQQMGRLVAQTVSTFEGALSGMATALAAHFKWPERDIVHVLRIEFRKARGAAVRSLRSRLDELAANVEIDLKEDGSLERAPDDAERFPAEELLV